MIPQVKFSPVLIATKVVSVGGVSWLQVLRPQHVTVPSLLSPQALNVPAETATKSVPVDVSLTRS